MDLASLPVEVLDEILSLVDGEDLAHVAQTCRSLYNCVNNEGLWRRLVRRHFDVESAEPYSGFHEMYSSLHQHNWLGHSLWYGDKPQFGSLVLSRYDPHSGTMELHEILCQHGPSRSRTLNGNRTVAIEQFAPRIGCAEFPVARLGPDAHYDDPRSLCFFNHDRALHTCIMRVQAMRGDRVHPSMALWPPLTLPAKDRMRSGRSSSPYPSYPYSPTGSRPGSRPSSRPSSRPGSQPGSRSHSPTGTGGSPTLSPAPSGPSSPRGRDLRDLGRDYFSRYRSVDSTTDGFRLRKWVSFSQSSMFGVAMGESVETFSRLDQRLIAPTPDMPWRGLWLGDYHDNGGQFVMFHQPNPTRLEAIKLTGDVHVPRGEYTFIVEDIKHKVPISYPEWPGAPVVQAHYQVAETNYINPRYLESQLILVSDDCVVHYRLGRELVTYLYRVDVDKLLEGAPGWRPLVVDM
uniref:ARAD1C34650p n=1 Tax=Blastobotrys adeninivorans TaxID=409370 RepID=A0A060T352_BLAAD